MGDRRGHDGLPWTLWLAHSTPYASSENSLYRCFDRRADALFELTDALLTAGPVPSPPHLSLAAIHRRRWGSLYAALSMGRTDEAGLRDLLSRHSLGDGDLGHPPIYAVDVSVWPRCATRRRAPSEATTTPPEPPLRRSTHRGRIWAYQLVAQLGFERDSWVAPVDARRVKPTENTDETAAEQVRALVQRLPEPEAMPIFVFDAGYTIR